MAQQYHQGQRELQDRFDTRRLADRLGEAAADSVGPEFAAFIQARDMFFLATADADGAPDCSYKGGDPGFAHVVDPTTLTFPVYDGNGMFRSLGNIVVNPAVGLLFVDLEEGSRLRVNGRARLEWDGELVMRYPGASGVVVVTVESAFANCRRYVHQYRKVEASPFVPDEAGEAPVPDWKLHEWFDGTLAASDPAHDPERPSAPAIPHF
jgi:predicted pyridoxine 5'-phosphate oxidase superfamily flavin-nucleotide-binding protein